MNKAAKGWMAKVVTLPVLCGVWVSAQARGADTSGQMNTFRLSGLSFLKGFVAKPAPHSFGSLFERPPHASAVFNACYFHGRSELRYSVLLFPSTNALQLWDKRMSATAPGWFSPLRSPKDGQGVRRMSLGGEIHADWPNPTAIVVNRVLIAIYPYQHGTTATGALPNKEFVQIVEKVKAELTGRAKRFRANKAEK